VRRHQRLAGTSSDNKKARARCGRIIGLTWTMTVIEKLLVLFVWLALMAGGVPFILRHWSQAGDLEQGSIAAGVFIAGMTAVCVIGALAYASRNKEVSGGSDPPGDRILGAIKTSLIWQFGLGVPCVLMLDTGGSAHVAIVAVAAYWPIVFLIVLRRVHAPTTFDLVAIRHGYPFVWLAVAAFGPVIWTRMGHFGP
jgi:hypothetical protein